MLIKVPSLMKNAGIFSLVCRWGTCYVQGKYCISKNLYVGLEIKTKYGERVSFETLVWLTQPARVLSHAQL